MEFNDLEPKLSEKTLEALNSMGFVNPTPVQSATIPYFAANKVLFCGYYIVQLFYNCLTGCMRSSRDWKWENFSVCHSID